MGIPRILDRSDTIYFKERWNILLCRRQAGYRRMEQSWVKFYERFSKVSSFKNLENSKQNSLDAVQAWRTKYEKKA